MKKLLPLILAAMLVFVGCQADSSLKKKQMQTYVNDKAGYVLLMPSDWQKKYENNVSAGFVGSDPNVAVDIIFEIGGLDYFSLDSLADEVTKSYKKTFKEVKVIEKGASQVKNDAYRVIFEGKTPEGKEIVVKTIFFEPAIGIRYYIAFAANPKDYYANDYLFEEVAQSFEMTKSDQDLYKVLKDREEEEFKKQHEEMKKKAQEKKEKEKKENKNQDTQPKNNNE